MDRRLVIIYLMAIGILAGITAYNRFFKYASKSSIALDQNAQPAEPGGLINEPNPLSIEYMRGQAYPGSGIDIEQTLPSGTNYNKYIASYNSDGLKIYALLTVPQAMRKSSNRLNCKKQYTYCN